MKGKHFLKNCYSKTSHLVVANAQKGIIHFCLNSFALIFTEVIYTDLLPFFQLIQPLLILSSIGLGTILNTESSRSFMSALAGLFA